MRPVLLKSYPIAYDTHADDNHIYIHTVADDSDYSLAVNVQSNAKISRLYYCVKTYEQGQKQKLTEWAKLDEGKYLAQGKMALDYDTEDWFKAEEMQPAETEEEYIRLKKHHTARENKLSNVLLQEIRHAIKSPTAYIIAIGEQYGPKGEPDYVFKFMPAQGLHDIHRNHGFTDGAIFFFYPEQEKIIGVFTEFR